MTDKAWRTALRAMTGHADSLQPRRQWALSCVLVALFTALGWSALPRDLAVTAPSLELRDVSDNPTGIGAPVYALRENGVTVRFGNAAVSADGAIRIGFFDPLDPLLGTATEPVLLPADPRLLWLLASPTERQAVRESATELVRVLPQTLLAMLNSPEFTGYYRDRLVVRIRGDIDAAWRTARASGAWQDLLRGYEPIVRDAIARDIRPIIENRFRGVPMRLLRLNALQFVDPFRESRWDMAPVEEALQGALQEIRDRELPERTVSRLLAAPATADFIGIFASAMARELARDTPLRDLLSDMMFDERFRPYLNTLLAKGMDLGRVAPRLLVSLHGSTDLNPVASFVIRTLVSGRNDRVVVFMSPQQRDEMIRLDPDSVRPLAHEVAG